MENEDLTKTEIIDLVVEYNNNDTKQMLYFVQNDCKINFDIKNHGTKSYNGRLITYIYKIVYDNKFSEMNFYNSYTDDKLCIYNSEAKDVLIELFKLLSDEDIENIKNITLKMKERKKIKKYNSVNTPSININNNNNNTNINNNSNTSNIETYSDLRSFVENNTTIDDNVKQEIVNIIKEIEKAKDKKDFKSYVDLYSKLLTSLQATLNISPFIIQGFEWLKNLF